MTFRILIVDDFAELHAILAAAIEAVFSAKNKQSHSAISLSIDSAYQGQEALRLVKKAKAGAVPYDLVFMDMLMPPGWDGVKTSSKILAISPRSKIVVITAYSTYSWQDMVTAMGSGADVSLLSKPFGMEEVAEVIRQATAALGGE